MAIVFVDVASYETRLSCHLSHGANIVENIIIITNNRGIHAMNFKRFTCIIDVSECMRTSGVHMRVSCAMVM